MLSSLLIPAVLFFALGFLAKIIKSDPRFPSDLAKALSMRHGRKNLNDAAECGGALAILFPPGSSTAGPTNRRTRSIYSPPGAIFLHDFILGPAGEVGAGAGAGGAGLGAGHDAINDFVFGGR